jgi:hypothetical protein
MSMNRLLLLFLLIPTASSALSYEICFVGNNGRQCFTLETEKELDEVVATATYPNGDLSVTILGVDVDLRCKDTNGDGYDEECLLGVQASEEPEEYFPNGTVVSAGCTGTTLIERVANGFGATYTRPTINSDQCGYEEPESDPCYSGTWYTGYGNPLCEDTNGNLKYRKVCPRGTSGNYVLMAPGFCT